MTSPPPTRFSRTLGALLGVHAGDSLGATLEFQTFHNIKSQYPNGLREIVGGGVFNWPAGHATDDTDLTRAVLLAYRDRARSIAKSQSESQARGKQTADGSGIPAEGKEQGQAKGKGTGKGIGTGEAKAKAKAEGGHQESNFDITKSAADHSLAWLRGSPWPSRTPGSRPADIGNATAIGLNRYARSHNPYTSGSGPNSAGNGSLMRCIPTGLFVHERQQRARESQEISAITHDDERCTVACAVYNEIVASILEGSSVKESVGAGKQLATELGCQAVRQAVESGESLSPHLATLAASKNGPSSSSSLHPSLKKEYMGGYVLHSLKLAVAAVLDEGRSFEDVVVDVVRLGGDTDTNGAIAGGLLGVREGVERIPGRWRERLQFGGEFGEVVREMLGGEVGRS